jgi:two-component system, OmpR family, KDP operon response regulator KdpE
MVNQNLIGNVLIVDDSRSIRAVLRTLLSANGFAIVVAARGEEALEFIHTTKFDAVLLDIDMPGMNGIEALRIIRKRWPRLPITMMSVHDSEERKVEALDAGADDYITKPFHLRELAARLRSAVRRNKALDDYRAGIMIGDLLLDPERHQVEKGGRPVHLTPKQFEMLHYLMTHAGKPNSYAKLLGSIWGTEYAHQVEYLRTFIRQIRIKIEDDPAVPKYLMTDTRVGYRFNGGAHEDS